MRHTFWSCLIRCANMKWIRWVLLKIQSGHDSVHIRTDGWTDGQTDKVKQVYSPFQLRIINILHNYAVCDTHHPPRSPHEESHSHGIPNPRPEIHCSLPVKRCKWSDCRLLYRLLDGVLHFPRTRQVCVPLSCPRMNPPLKHVLDQ